MHRHDEGTALRRMDKEARTARARRLGPDAVAAVPLGANDLHRMVHDVGGEDRLLAVALQPVGDLVGPVTGGGLRFEQARGGAPVLAHFGEAGLEDRQHAVGERAAVHGPIAFVVLVFPIEKIVLW
ncbi:MAG: hypothetical protein M0002_05130 [Rhodospirillales bacterium]|nr:hypothetical protein [Rhodospirillales bacterium]